MAQPAEKQGYTLLDTCWKALIFLSFSILVFGLCFPPGLMAVVIATHVCLYLGFGLSVLSDWIARRPFSLTRFVLLFLYWLLVAMAGPVILATRVPIR